MLRDRDGLYGGVFSRRVRSLEIREVKTAPRSPWQNPYVECLIGTLRRECLNRGVPRMPNREGRQCCRRDEGYHFLDIETGRRVWNCELSTLDSAFLFAGALTCAAYFDADTEDEAEVRRLADGLYCRADWDWARDGGPTLTHGWKPETGFLPHRYKGYDEGLLLYILGLGSPTHPLPPESYAAYCASYQWKEIYGRELLYSGPLFTHQLSHLWVDFRGIRDAFMRERGSDYFENSRQATFVQQEYAIRNPLEFEGYGKHCWGFTACDGPGWIKRAVNGVERQFYDYIARGAPYGPTTARSLRGSWSPRCRSRRKSSSRLFASSPG